MTALDVFKLAGAILTGIGGAGAIIFGLSSFLGKLWADRALEEHRQKYNQLNMQMQHDLDSASRRLQIELDALGLVHSLRTKEEFDRLAGLWKRFSDLSAAFHALYSRGLDFFSSAKQADITYKNKLRDDFHTALLDFQNYFHQEMIFIPEPIAMVAGYTLSFASKVPYLELAIEETEDPQSRAKFYGLIQAALEQFSHHHNPLEELIRKHIRGESLGKTQSPS